MLAIALPFLILRLGLVPESGTGPECGWQNTVDPLISEHLETGP